MRLPDRLHFVGVGGAGMSGIAAVMIRRGARVCGSDQRESENTRRLRAMGADVHIGHRPEHVGDVDIVVVSAAVPPDNPEIIAARERGIPVILRAEALGRLMSEYKHRIAIAGTHGKTTTTSMTGLVLLEGGLDPTILVGGDVEAINGNARLGDGDVFVTEACEAFSSFLELRPSVAVITNIDADHLDHYRDFASIKAAFRQFICQVEDGGCVIACADDQGVRKSLASKEVFPALGMRLITYGVREDADLRAVDVDVDSPKASFSVMRDKKALGRIALNAPGTHNVLNALAAVAVGLEQGVSFPAIRSALAKYTGAGRRFEMLGEVGGVIVVDDYAHHPAEIAATLQAAKRGWRRRVVVVFQPHLYSRTKFFLKDFADSLSLAARVIVTDIYAAREKPIPGVSACQIIEAMDESGRARAEYIPNKADIADRLLPDLRPDDMVIVMGAGDIREVGEEIVSKLAGAGSKETASEAGVK